MPGAIYSAENRIRERQRALGISANTLAAISGVARERLHQAMNGTRNLENPDAIKVLGTLDDLRNLADAAAPIPISWADVGVIRNLLNDWRNKRLSVVVSVERTEQAERSEGDK